MKIKKYIEINYNGNKAAFGRSLGVDGQTVNKWVNSKWIVIDGRMYSPRRLVNEKESLK